MNFKNVDPFVFKNRWNLKKEKILKSELFQLNNLIIKDPSDFSKKFFPGCLELTSL
jgi:hypothetical protein